jgi:NTP pyrophosphatase (non-canonical NTP hydrolase)
VISSISLQYYNKKFGNSTSAAFIHLVREIGEIAFAIEKNSTGVAQTKITEAVVILLYLSSKYGIDIEENLDLKLDYLQRSPEVSRIGI